MERAVGMFRHDPDVEDAAPRPFEHIVERDRRTRGEKSVEQQYLIAAEAEAILVFVGSGGEERLELVAPLGAHQAEAAVSQANGGVAFAQRSEKTGQAHLLRSEAHEAIDVEPVDAARDFELELARRRVYAV